MTYQLQPAIGTHRDLSKSVGLSPHAINEKCFKPHPISELQSHEQ